MFSVLYTLFSPEWYHYLVFSRVSLQGWNKMIALMHIFSTKFSRKNSDDCMFSILSPQGRN